MSIYEQGPDTGFTLVETLVAFVILALSIGIVTQSISQATRQAASAHSLDLAVDLAKQTLAVGKLDRSRTSNTGSDASVGLSWTWERSTIPRQDGSGPLHDIERVLVSVNDMHSGRVLFRLRSLGASP